MRDDVRSDAHVHAVRSTSRAGALGAALAVAATASLLLAGSAAPAAATSCAPYEFDPMGFAAGGAAGGVTVEPPSLTTADEWRRGYAGVDLGTVVEVEGLPADLPTVIDVDVTGTFGPPVPSRVEMHSPGSIYGYGFERGVHYLIPYKQPGFESFLCDPIFVVPEADVPALVAASETGLWPRPSDAPAHRLGVLLPEPEPKSAVAPGQAPRDGWPLLVGSVVAGSVVLALLLRRRRADRRPPTAASDSRQSTGAAGSTPDA